MPQSPDDPNQRDTPTTMVLVDDQESGADLAVESANVPEKLGIVADARLALGKMVDSKWYRRIQMLASFASVFAESGYRAYCGLSGHPEDQAVVEFLRSGFDPIFAVNLGAKLGARGVSHLKTAEAWIDILTIGSSHLDFLPTDNARAARIIKNLKGGSGKLLKFARAASVAAGKQELEDKSMDEIGERFTWFMMYVLAHISAVFDFKEIDYTDPVSAASEPSLAGGLIVGSKIFLELGIRKVINKNYTRDLQGSRDRIHQMIDENPELEFLRTQFEDFDENASARLQEDLGINEKKLKKLIVLMQKAEKSSVDPKLVWSKWAAKHGVTAKYEDYSDRVDRVMKNEILVIVEGMMETMVDMKELINPVGEDMELDAKGVIKTKELDAVVMVTDLRNFTSLSSSRFIRGNILGFLKLNYFRYLRSVIKKHGGKILNHTGDGLVIYFTDQGDRSKYERSHACSKEINEMTNMMDEIWKEEGVSLAEDNHQTGIGLSSGTIRIGDVLTLSKETPSTSPDSSVMGIQRIQHAFESRAEKSESEWASIIRRDLNAMGMGKNRAGGISRLVGLGEPINVAARLEAVSKDYPDYTAFVRESHLIELPDDQILEYKPLREVQLKGVDEVEMVYGLPRYQEEA